MTLSQATPATAQSGAFILGRGIMETALAITAAAVAYVYLASCVGSFLSFNDRPQRHPRSHPDLYGLGKSQGEAGSFHIGGSK